MFKHFNIWKVLHMCLIRCIIFNTISLNIIYHHESSMISDSKIGVIFVINTKCKETLKKKYLFNVNRNIFGIICYTTTKTTMEVQVQYVTQKAFSFWDFLVNVSEPKNKYRFAQIHYRNIWSKYLIIVQWCNIHFSNVFTTNNTTDTTNLLVSIARGVRLFQASWVYV